MQTLDAPDTSSAKPTLGTVVVTEEDGGGNTIADNATVDFSVIACGGPFVIGSVAMVNGVATLTVSRPSSGQVYTVTYGGDANYFGNSASITLAVSRKK